MLIAITRISFGLISEMYNGSTENPIPVPMPTIVRPINKPAKFEDNINTTPPIKNNILAIINDFKRPYLSEVKPAAILPKIATKFNMPIKISA